MIGDNMVRIGIVGTNFISEWFMAGARRTGGRVDPVAVYSRSADRAAVVVAPGFGDAVLGTLEVNAARRTLRCDAVLIPDAAQRRVLCSLAGAVPLPRQDLMSGYLPESSIGGCGTWVSGPTQSWLLST